MKTRSFSTHFDHLKVTERQVSTNTWGQKRNGKWPGYNFAEWICKLTFFTYQDRVYSNRLLQISASVSPLLLLVPHTQILATKPVVVEASFRSSFSTFLGLFAGQPSWQVFHSQTRHSWACEWRRWSAVLCLRVVFGGKQREARECR